LRYGVIKNLLISNMVSTCFKIWVLVICSCVFSIDAHGQKIKIHIYNKTGHDLDSVTWDGHYLGHIQKDSAFVFTGIDEFITQSMVPFVVPSALVNGRKAVLQKAKCSTKTKLVKSGVFYFDLLLWDGANGLRLYWQAPRSD
jgi:hypothetical protein